LISLRDINWNNFWGVVNLKVSEEQKNNLPSNAVFMAQAYINLKMQYKDICFAIYYNDDLIGFTKIVFIEQNEEKFNFSEDTYYIDAIMIDEKYQGKGYGKLALSKILDFIQTEPWGKVRSVKLSCYDTNKAAINLYTQFGFVRTDIFVFGKEDLRLYIMQ